MYNILCWLIDKCKDNISFEDVVMEKLGEFSFTFSYYNKKYRIVLSEEK